MSTSSTFPFGRGATFLAAGAFLAIGDFGVERVPLRRDLGSTARFISTLREPFRAYAQTRSPFGMETNPAR